MRAIFGGGGRRRRYFNLIRPRHVGEKMAIPVLLAAAAVHHRLVAGRSGAPMSGLVLETGAAREVHDFAVLAGYGAEAIIRIWRIARCWMCACKCKKMTMNALTLIVTPLVRGC